MNVPQESPYDCYFGRKMKNKIMDYKIPLVFWLYNGNHGL
jgi:hypothetical protein